MESSRTILISGSSGLIGQALATHLTAAGHSVRTLVRRPARSASESTWDPARGFLTSDALEGVDAIVNLAGAPVGTHRWTTAYKAEIMSSRTGSTSLLAESIAARVAAGHSAPILLNASAVGFYGDRGAEVLTEESAVGGGFLADVVTEWEDATRTAEDAGARVVHLRTGIVLSEDGGALKPLLRLLKLGVGGPIGSGTQTWSWITLTDEVRAIAHLLDSTLSGPVNLTAPGPVTNQELTRALAHELRRPSFLAAPALALRVVLGEFSEDILSSAYVFPAALTRDGFDFLHPDITSAARWVTHH